MLPPGHQAQSLYSQSQHSEHGQSLADALGRDEKGDTVLPTVLTSLGNSKSVCKSSTNCDVILSDCRKACRKEHPLQDDVLAESLEVISSERGGADFQAPLFPRIATQRPL